MVSTDDPLVRYTMHTMTRGSHATTVPWSFSKVRMVSTDDQERPGDAVVLPQKARAEEPGVDVNRLQGYLAHKKTPNPLGP